VRYTNGRDEIHPIETLEITENCHVGRLGDVRLRLVGRVQREILSREREKSRNSAEYCALYGWGTIPEGKHSGHV